MTHSIEELNSMLKKLSAEGFSLRELVTTDVFNYLVIVSEDLDEPLEDIIDDWLEDRYNEVYIDCNLLKSLATAKL